MWDRLPGVALGSAAAGALAAYLVLVVPVSGALAGQQLRRRLGQDGTLRLTVYRRTISRHWLLAGVAVGVAGAAKMPVSALGFRWPRLTGSGPAGLLAGAAMLVTVAIAAAVLAGSRPLRPIAGLLPVTPEERRLYAGVAVTAGIVEELLFRGFLMQYATGVLGWSWQSAAAASTVAFGVSHLYQGPATAAAAALIGLGFAESYTLTASLLVPVLLHVALDLRVLARPGTPSSGRRGRRTCRAQKCSAQKCSAQKCSGASNPSSRSPVWNTCGGDASVPSPASSNRVGAVVDA